MAGQLLCSNQAGKFDQPNQQSSNDSRQMLLIADSATPSKLTKLEVAHIHKSKAGVYRLTVRETPVPHQFFPSFNIHEVWPLMFTGVA